MSPTKGEAPGIYGQRRAQPPPGSPGASPRNYRPLLWWVGASTGRHGLMSRPLRGAIGSAAAANLAVATAFALQTPWALELWPWDTGRLSYLFLASMSYTHLRAHETDS